MREAGGGMRDAGLLIAPRPAPLIDHWHERSYNWRHQRPMIFAKGKCRPAGLVAMLAFVSGCLDAARINARCEWTGDSAFAFDASNARHRAHLEGDVRIAQENAIRYGDATVRARRIGLESWNGLTLPCLDTLYARIESAHGVTRATIESSSGTRDSGADTLFVWLPTALLFVAGAHLLTRRVLRRSRSSDSRLGRVVMLLWLGLSVSAVSVGIAHFWGWTVEEWRLRTHHLSFRARYLPVGMYAWQAYAAAVILWALVAMRVSRVSMRRASSPPSLEGWKR